MENSKLRPAVAPAAMRNTTSFLVEQGQIPRAAKSAVPVKPHPSKPVTLQMATQWVDSIEKGTGTGTEEDLNRQEPALRCFVKYLRKISYSDKYTDDGHEYRHVTLPRQQAQDLYKVYKDRVSIAPLLEKLFKGELLDETEWREIGVQQSLGWVHYCNHRPEPHILLFSRALPQPLPQPTPTSDLSSKMGRLLSFN